METNNFIEEFIKEDLATGRYKNIHMRFPPEPNGYLHLGHAFSICLQFTTANKFGGLTNLRFDDTNPLVEETEYVDAIREDVKWLGFNWGDREYYASDYFDKLYALAEKLILQGDAYVDDSTPEEIAEQKGTPTKPGTGNNYRNRSVEENMDLFKRMKAGEFKDGERVLRAKIDLSSPNMLLRDPLIYRIKHTEHHRTGNKWCIYPMYDFAHGQSDSIENISHSVCTLEFENHRPLYNWFIEKLNIFPSRQIEFARLNFTYTVMGKRKMIQMVNKGDVTGWDDPRMPTISGARRRGYPAAAIREFNERVGVAKRDKLIDLSLLEFFVRKHLNASSSRLMAVLNPVKLTITNLPEDHAEWLTTDNNPEDENAGTREIKFGKNLFIERDDFREQANKKFFRLKLGGRVRLKSAYIIEAESCVKDENGEIIEVLAKYVPESKSGSDTSGLKVKGTIHWVNQSDAVDATVNQYDRLFTDETPDSHEGKDFRSFLNPNSLEVLKSVKVEPTLATLPNGTVVQFLRKGYFAIDKTSTPEALVFNRTVTLKDNYKKKQG